MNNNIDSYSVENLLAFLRVIERMLSDISKDKSISPLQYEALKVINQNSEKCSMKILANSLKISMASATQLIDRMINAELVERFNYKNDRRVVLLRLTKVGFLELKRIVLLLNNYSQKLFENLSKEEVECFKKVMTKIISNF